MGKRYKVVKDRVVEEKFGEVIKDFLLNLSGPKGSSRSNKILVSLPLTSNS